MGNFKDKKFKRIRYMTSHPVDFTEDLIDAHHGKMIN